MSYPTAIYNINKIIQATFNDSDERVVVLEAGCGSLSRIKVPPNKLIVGIDISIEQLKLNENLDLKVCADLKNTGLRDNSIDIICCWDVLEHLEYPETVLSNFYDWIKPGGLIVLKNPNPFCLKGILTKFTPYIFHIFVHTRIFKSYETDPNYLGPFKTYMKPSIHRSKIIESALLQHIFPVYSLSYTGAFPMRNLYRVISSILKCVTLGKTEVETEQVLVLKAKK